MLMYTSNNPRTAAIASEVNFLLTRCKNKFKMAKPNLWPKELHSGPFPKMMCIIDWAKGVWDQNQPQGRDTKMEYTSHRKIPTFISANKHEERIKKVVLECRRQGMERAIFGEHSFFKYVLGNNESKETKKRMLKKVKHHGAVQKYLGCETMTGMVNSDYKVKSDLHDDEGGER